MRERMINPGDRGVDRLDTRHADALLGAAQHNDGQRERTRRGDLPIGRGTAAVFGDQDIDVMGHEQRAFVRFAKWPAAGDVRCVRHGERRLDGIDAAHEVVVLRRLDERRQFLAAESDKHASCRSSERAHGGRHVGDIDPAVACNGDPGRPLEREQPHTARGRSLRGIGRDHCGIRMRCIDQRVDPLPDQIVGKPLETTEPPYPHRHGLGCGFGGASGQRQRHLEVGARRKALAELPRLCRAAENENAHVVC